MTVRALTVSGLLLMTIGAGCAIRPRMVRAPQRASPPVSQVNSNNATPTLPEMEEDPTSLTADAVVAYAKLDAGETAIVTRGEETVSIQNGTELLSGDRLATATSTIEMIYPDAGMSQLEPGSDVIVLSRESESSGDQVAAQVELLAGRIWTRFERVFGEDEEFSVVGNGVVATVRGTGFGVEKASDGTVDIQVADHAVEVTLLDAEETTWQQSAERNTAPVFASGQRVKLQAGQALRMPSLRTPETGKNVASLVRTLSDADRRRAGFVFAKTFLPSVKLRKPAKIIRLMGAAQIPQELRQRVQFLRTRENLRRTFLKFQAPTIVPNLNPTGDLRVR